MEALKDVSKPSLDSRPLRPLRMALPTGRMEGHVLELLSDAGVEVTSTVRSYRPTLSLAGVDAKRMKPQNIAEMLAHGSRDVGFAGADWVEELGADVVELIDTGLDPVRVIAAAPRELEGRMPERRLVVASEYERLAKRWIEAKGLDAEFFRTYGATEVYPPEDADIIIDNTATGSTLRANNLVILDTLMRSSTRFYASRQALDDSAKRNLIDDLCLLLNSVLEARKRVMVEVNVPAERMDAVVALLPCMREVTVARLFGDSGLAVKAAIPRDRLSEVIPAIKAAGGNDVVVTSLAQIVP